MTQKKKDPGREQPMTSATWAPDPPEMDMEAEPQPAQAPETDSNRNDNPPARSGPAAENPEHPTEGEPRTNPIRHKGHIPPPVS
ncbi:MAG: hypothetical protein QHC90_13520 [Shinella sp.]|nr:hypothetical protein [Shinella sp.]